MKTFLKLAVGLLLAGALLWVFFRGIDPGDMLRAVRSARPGWLVGCLALTLVHYLLRAWRWRLLLTPLRPRLPMRTLTEAVLAGYAVTFTVPGRLGELVRPALLSRREGLPLAGTITTVVLDRILDAAALAVLLAAFLAVGTPPGLPAEHLDLLHRTGRMVGLAVAVVLPSLWLLSRFRERIVPAGADGGIGGRLSGLVRSVLEGLAVLHGPRPLAGAVAGSGLIWLVLAGQAWCGVRAFGLDLPFTASWGLVGFLAVGIAVPTPAGAGGYHAAGRFFLERVAGAEADLAVTAMLVLHLISVLPAMILGAVVLAREGVSLGDLLSRGSAGGATGPAEGRP